MRTLKPDDLNSVIGSLIHPEKLFSRVEVLQKKCPVPTSPGIYAWFFKEIPEDVPTEGCIKFADKNLLYVGISPKKPPRMGKPSSQNLRKRIKNHYRGNAEGSTLRLTLGCLLSEKIGIELRRVGSGKRMTFHDGEDKLSTWMNENAFVSWVVHEEPWRVEDQTIKQLSLPLNLRDNESHPFHRYLSSKRRDSKRGARAKSILPKVQSHVWLSSARIEGVNMIRVTAGLLEKKGKLLIAQRRSGDILEYKWELPGGKIEDDESPEDCLKRELFEEFSINIEVDKFFGSNEHEYEHGHIELLAYRVKHISGEFSPISHENIQWVIPEKLMEYDFAEADKPLIQKYLKEKHVI